MNAGRMLLATRRMAPFGLPAAVIVAVASASSDTIPAKLTPFPLADVRLLDGPFQRAEQANRRALLALDPERLLYPFLKNAAVPTTVAPYGGWEAPDWDFPGHTLGHYLTACAQMAARGDEPEFRRRVDAIVTGLAECQRALAAHASHPGFLDPQPEAAFERIERGEGGAGVPYYTLHKTLAGLLDAHTLAGNREALEIARGLAQWLAFRLGRLDDAQLQRALRIEHGGISEALADLHAITGDPVHLRVARRLNHRLFVDAFARNEDPLEPDAGPRETRLLHGNTQVPKALGAARQYELTGDPVMRVAATNFWRNVVESRSFIFGGNTDGERFYARGTDAQHLSPRTGEGCNTYNLLKLTRHLFAWEPSAGLMDYYERALINHVLAAQNPDTGHNTYFMSLEPGGRKRFGTAEHTFWCCTGSSFESHAKYADTIYFHGPDRLAVNLFIASELHWRQRSLRLRQHTRFPESDTTEFVVEAASPQRFTLQLRWPGWSGAPRVVINGETQSLPHGARPSSYLDFDREWREGDRIVVHFAMALRMQSLADDPSLVAFLYGPLVLAGDLGREGVALREPEFVDNGKDPRGPRVAELPAVPPVLVGPATELVAHLRPLPGVPATFKTDGVARPRDVTLVPLYRIVDEDYTVYFKRCDEAGWVAAEKPWQAAEQRRSARLRRIVDAVWAGHAGSETAHDLTPRHAPVVSSRLSLYRDATSGSVRLKLKRAQGAALELRVGYLDAAAAAFDLFVDGTLIAKERPARPAPPEPNRAATTSIKTYALPPTAAKPILEVEFVGCPDQGPARIVFCEVVRAVE